jgi:asparagine synthase (glutamine-hydrolysing)
MCGFAGVIAWDERYRTNRETLARMSAAIAHRGPDGEGIYFNHEDEITPQRPQCALAFRRLAILDPDPRSDQPFSIGGKTLVFNGEIYNFRDLRKELSGLRPEYAWRTSGDTEVLLMAYEVWAEKCLEKLNGMFAFAVWDASAKSLFLARDRMGQKPLYVSPLDSKAIYFASEIGAIPKHTSPAETPMWWGNYLRYGFSSPSSPWLDIAAMRLGTWSLFQDGTIKSAGPYFDAGRLTGKRVDDLAAPRTTRDLLLKSVERQLVSDVPLGIFLSGGIDSSCIAAAARRSGPVKTFAIRFEDPRYDESKYAREVAAHLGTEHHEFLLTPDAATDLPKLALAFGEPFGDSSALPTHYLARAVRGHVKVALSGDGGDELFGGYDRYRAMRWAERLRVFGLVGQLAGPFTGGDPKLRMTRAARFLASLRANPADRYDGYLRIFDERRLNELAPNAGAFQPLSKEAFEIAQHAHPPPVEAALACDRMRYLPDDLLTKVDRCSMLHGLEVRSPFMDHELVQFAAGLTTDQLLKGGPKRMLREAFAADLPDFVFKRKKMGFAVPIGEWFRGPLRAMLRDHLFASDSFASAHFNRAVVERLVEEHEQSRVDHSQRLYALLMLELWWKKYR